MRFLILALLCTGTAFAQNGLATRADATNAIDGAKTKRTTTANFVVSVEAEIDAIPAGPVRDAIEIEWTAFVIAWTSSDSAAESHIAIAEARLADGDAATDPMLQGLYYAQATSAAMTAQNQLDMLEDDYDLFLTAIAGTGWTPTTTTPW